MSRRAHRGPRGSPSSSWPPPPARKPARTAVKDSLDELFDRFDKDIPGADDALVFGARRRARVHFKFTLVMPGPILRANTCFSGDTATWEFDDEDLYVHGFDIRARAAAPSAP